MDGLYRYVRGPKGVVFKSFWSETGYVNWVCFLGKATSSSFGDQTISLLMFTPTLYVRALRSSRAGLQGSGLK